MNNGDGSPKELGGLCKFSPDFDDSQRKQFELLITDARANAAEAEKYYMRAAYLAKEWRQTEACVMAISELAEIYMQEGKHEDELRALKEIERIHKSSVRQDAALIRLDMRIGICYLRLKNTEKAVESLRGAVVRCQTSSTDSIDDFVDSLCSLAEVYRAKDWHDRAKTCIKQAYAIVAEEADRQDLQGRVLEELAHVAYDQHRLKEAVSGFVQALKLKQNALGSAHPALIDPFVALGLCYLELHNYEDAASSFIQALELMRVCNKGDRHHHANQLNKLAGVYRKQARFLEASLLEQGACEILGRAVEQKLGYFKEFEAALTAHQAKQYDMAIDSYRKTLVMLEFVFDKNGFVRVPILCRLAELAEERQQKIQFRSLVIEIEEGLHPIATGQDLDICGRLLQLARLFRLLKFDGFADSCYRFAVRIQRKNPDERQAAIMNEHLSLLAHSEPSQESMQMKKYLRRACRVLGAGQGTFSVLAISAVPEPEAGSHYDLIAEII